MPDETTTKKGVPANFQKGVMDDYETLQEEQEEIELAVGHAGLFWRPKEEGGSEAKLVDKDGVETLVQPTIVLGDMGKGNNLSLSVEQGVADYVKELAGDPTNHLPDTKVGVVMYYLSQGLAADFGTTWDRAPASLSTGRRGSSDRQKGKRPLSKAEKNQLIEKLDISYYDQDIKSGRLTLEEAFAEVKKAYSKKEEIEKLGYYLSPLKTEGVLLFDWKNLVNKTYESVPDITASGLYVFEKLEVVLPNLYQNYFEENHKNANRKTCQEVVKSALGGCVIEDLIRFKLKGLDPKSIRGIDGDGVQFGGLAQDQDITSTEDILKLVGHKPKGQVMGIHLGKLKKSGLMKPRYIVIDEYKDGHQTLYLYDKSGSLITLKN